MTTSNISNRRLNQFFVTWIVLANTLLLLWPWAIAMDRWLGSGFLWAGLIPMACLIWLNPRRSWGLLLATAGIGVWMVRRTGKLLPKRPSMARVSVH